MSEYRHNGGPELEANGWQKKYFYMPVERALNQIELLEFSKSLFAFPTSKAAKEMAQVIDEQIAFLKEKLR